MGQDTNIDRQRSEIAAVLARHGTRRESGFPAVSVLIGVTTLCEYCWSEWADSRHCSRIQLDLPRIGSATARVTTALLRQRDLITDALNALSRRLGRDARELRAEWSVKTEADRSLWLNRLGLSEEVSDHDQLCQVLLTKVALRNGDRTEHGLAATFQDRLDWTPARLLGAICRLLPAEELPVVGFTWRDASLEWLPSTAEELFSLASAAPRLPIALLLPPAATRLFLERSHESRAITFLREGLIDLSKTHHGCTQHHVDEEADCDRRTSGVGPSEAVLSDIEKDAARSAAERFLFEVLEATPATTGLFALNVKLDFPFGGSRPAEIDLACRPYKLAIEIDGHYHFLDMESYRRDRRKDVELQRRGWLVMRFLADDVGPRQEEIVAAIVSAVAERRREGQR